MVLLKNKLLFTGIIIFCITVLIFAFFIEYVLKHVPCNLCLFERIPYIGAIVLSFVVLFADKYEKIVLITIGLLFVFGTFISFYHFGIEQGFFNESLVCDLDNASRAVSTEDLLKELKAENISCKDVTFRIFGLSLATFNTIISFLISAIMLSAVINYEKN